MQQLFPVTIGEDEMLYFNYDKVMEASVAQDTDDMKEANNDDNSNQNNISDD